MSGPVSVLLCAADPISQGRSDRRVALRPELTCCPSGSTETANVAIVAVDGWTRRRWDTARLRGRGVTGPCW